MVQLGITDNHRHSNWPTVQIDYAARNTVAVKICSISAA